MELEFHLKRIVARSVVRWILVATGVILLLLEGCFPAQASQTDSDYLLPESVNGGFIHQTNSIQSKQPSRTKNTAVSYQAFDGTSYQLVENPGRYVNVLLPASFDEGPFFTEDHIEELVDQLDILYATYGDIVQNEPTGNGLLNVAFVPETCGSGCGLLGWKGIEIRSESITYESIISELNSGRLSRLLLHEIGHNFDVYSRYLHYLPDHAHAWTEMFEYFAPHRYSRINSRGMAADDLYKLAMNATWKDYVTRQSANWEHCVKDDQCEDIGLPANKLWAMLYYRIEALHGIEAVLGSFEFLKTYTRKHIPPGSIEEMEGLRILSLAVGTGTNISCYMDALKWPVDSGTTKEMQKRFGNHAGLCADQDKDGFNAVNGDCDDSNALRNISQAEIVGNGFDDDCDELVDESMLSEAEPANDAGNYSQTTQTQLPFEVQGSSLDESDTDSFRFKLGTSGRVLITFCARQGFSGWVIALRPDGHFLEVPNYFSYQSSLGCSSNTFDFGEYNTGALMVMPDETAANYSLIVSNADELQADLSPLLQIEPYAGGGMSLQVSDQNDLFSDLGAKEVEIWISGVAERIVLPFNGGSSIQLNSFTAPSLQRGQTYQARVRPLAVGLQMAAFSAGHLFRYDPYPGDLPELDHRFSGAWFDSSHDGEGFLVEILENKRAVVYWFTYRPDGVQRWMVGVGDVEGNQIMVPELMDTRGGKFGANFNPDDVVMKKAGSLTLSFSNCSSALVNYSVDNIGGHQDNTRLTQLHGHRCENNDPILEKDLSGSWYDPSHDGEGFIVQQISESEAVVVWFSYDDEGNQSWMLNTGSISNGTIHINDLHQPKGGEFGRAFKPESVTRYKWGELTLDLDCSGGSASYKTQVRGF